MIEKQLGQHLGQRWWPPRKIVSGWIIRHLFHRIIDNNLTVGVDDDQERNGQFTVGVRSSELGNQGRGKGETIPRHARRVRIVRAGTPVQGTK